MELPFRVGTYTLTRLIGEGADAMAFECISQQYQQTFVAKITAITDAVLDENGNLADMELYALHQLDHPNIIRMYDYFLFQGYLFTILENCTGGTLADEIERKKALDLTVCQSYMKQIVSALAASHKSRIAHRDIKPHNIFISSCDQAKLADFGLSTFVRKKVNTQCGTMSYLAPEIRTSPYYCPYKADIWSLGVTFFEMATGENPFPEGIDDFWQTTVVFPRVFCFPLKKMIMSMLEVDPKFRPTPEQILAMDFFSIDFNAVVPQPMVKNANPPRVIARSNPSFGPKFNQGSAKKASHLIVDRPVKQAHSIHGIYRNSFAPKTFG